MAAENEAVSPCLYCTMMEKALKDSGKDKTMNVKSWNSLPICASCLQSLRKIGYPNIKEEDIAGNPNAVLLFHFINKYRQRANTRTRTKKSNSYMYTGRKIHRKIQKLLRISKMKELGVHME